MKGLAGLIAAVVLVPVAVLSQQRDARPTPPTPAGTGEISGVVLTADPTPQPMRRVIVSITGGDLASMRSVLTDDAGKFTFNRLNAGTFTISAKKAAYLPAMYGSMRPGRPGSPIVLAAGQRVAITVTVFKGAVIAGTLRDSAGLPVAGVPVSVVDARTVPASASLMLPGITVVSTAPSTVTDDRGGYRLFGLMPGEYFLTARPSPAGEGGIGARSTAELDAVLATLSQRQMGLAATTSPAGTQPAPPLPMPPSIGYAPIYFPGTAWYSEAATIKVAAGEEREGVNFEVSHVRVATVTGTVSGDVPNLAAVELILTFAGPSASGLIGTGGITSTPPDARGEFKFSNMPPGQYQIIARAKRGATAAAAVSTAVSYTSSGGGGTPLPGAGPPQPNVDQLFAIADVEVRGQDIAGVGLQLQSGGTLSGKIVFDAAKATPPTDLSAMRVQLSTPGGTYTSTSGSTRVGNGFSLVNPVVPGAGGAFQFIGIGPGPYAISCQLPADLASVWKLRSAMANGRELLDDLIEGPAVQMTGVTLTLSDKRTELSGTLQSAAGQPTTDYYVIVFAADRAQWRPGSRRTLSARPDTAGRFKFADLPAGEYFLAALTDLDPAEWQTPAFLAEVMPAAIKVTVAEGEVKVQDLRIR